MQIFAILFLLRQCRRSKHIRPAGCPIQAAAPHFCGKRRGKGILRTESRATSPERWARPFGVRDAGFTFSLPTA